MPSPDVTICFLAKNFEQFQELGKLEEFLPIIEAMKVSMTEAQFDLAMTNLTMSAANRDAARLFLVYGKTASELNSDNNISASRLSKILKRVVSNFEKQLDALQLVSCEYMLDVTTANLVRELEAAKVSEAKLKAAAGGKKRPARKSGK